jgi:osmoprotectant transport system permease protein
LRNPILSLLGVIQPLPSLAVLALLLPLLGVGKTNAIVALSLYALFPIVLNTATGLAGVPPQLVEAATGIGFTRRQRLMLVEFPLALPVIIAGIRTAAVFDVGIATLAALIGAGGLGDFILRGLSMINMRLTLLGAVSAIVLSLVVYFGIGLIERLLRRHRLPPQGAA